MSPVLRTTLLEGETGQQRWQWQVPVDHDYARVGRNPGLRDSRLRPILLRRADGQQRIAVWTSDRGRRRLHLITRDGGTASEREVGGSHRQMRPWPCDADQDGDDELVYFEGDSVALLSGKNLQTVWQIPSAQTPTGQTITPHIAGVLRGDSDRLQVLVQGIDGDRSLSGLDARTGNVLWRCLSPRVSLGYPNSLSHNDQERPILLSLPRDGHPPMSRFRFGDVSACRQAVTYQGPEDGSGATGSLVSLAAQRNATRAAPVVQPIGHDPRYVRPLPWKPNEGDVARLPILLAGAIFYGLTLAALPVALLVSLGRRRRWGMKAMFLLPVVVAVFIMAASVDLPQDGLNGATERVLFAYFGAGPVLFTLILLTVWGSRRQWRRLAGTLGTGCVVALAIMALIFTVGSISGGGLLPGERWSWEGWYGIFLPLGYALSWLVTLTVPVVWVLERSHRKRRQKQLVSRSPHDGEAIAH